MMMLECTANASTLIIRRSILGFGNGCHCLVCDYMSVQQAPFFFSPFVPLPHLPSEPSDLPERVIPGESRTIQRLVGDKRIHIHGDHVKVLNSQSSLNPSFL
jgi:hypothetical protein